MNILSHAIDALPERTEQPDKQIALQAKLVAPNQIQLWICDNASRIGSEIINTIFSLFSTTNPVGKGSGLRFDISTKLAKSIRQNRGLFPGI